MLDRARRRKQLPENLVMPAETDRKSRPPKRRGSAVIEMALIAPAIFLVFFAALEYSRMNMVRHSLDNAAYEGARRAMMPGANSGNVQQAAAEVLSAVSVRGAEVVLQPDPITQETEQVTVTVQAPCRGNSWAAPFFFRDRTFSATCTLSRELME